MVGYAQCCRTSLRGDEADRRRESVNFGVLCTLLRLIIHNTEHADARDLVTGELIPGFASYGSG